MLLSFPTPGFQELSSLEVRKLSFASDQRSQVSPCPLFLFYSCTSSAVMNPQELAAIRGSGREELTALLSVREKKATCLSASGSCREKI